MKVLRQNLVSNVENAGKGFLTPGSNLFQNNFAYGKLFYLLSLNCYIEWPESSL